METTTLLKQLRQERAELDAAIALIEKRTNAPTAAPSGSSSGSPMKGKPLSTAHKKKISMAIRARRAAAKKRLQPSKAESKSS